MVYTGWQADYNIMSRAICKCIRLVILIKDKCLTGYVGDIWFGVSGNNKTKPLITAKLYYYRAAFACFNTFQILTENILNKKTSIRAHLNIQITNI
jgi:hypothetical protein